MIAAGFNRVYPWWVRSFGRVHGPFGTSVCPGGWLIIELRDIRVDGAPDIDPGSRVCGSTYAESVREYCEPGPSTSRLIRATPRLNRVQPFPFHVTRPLSSSLSLSFLLASLHSCSPFPRVINHALNSTLSLSLSRVHALRAGRKFVITTLEQVCWPPSRERVQIDSIPLPCAYRLFHDRVVRKISGGRSGGFSAVNFFGEMAAPFVTTIPWKGRSRRNTVHEGFAINFYICIARFRSRASKSMVEISR